MLEDGLIYEMPQLYTERLILRKMRIKDAKDVYEYASDPEVAKYVAWEIHKSIYDSRKYLRLMQKRYKKYIIADWGIVLKETGKLVGSCGYVNWNRAHNYGEIGYVLSRTYWNHGIMSEAVNRIIKYGFNTMKLNRIEAYHIPENIASEKVMQKSGMAYEGLVRERFLAKGTYYDAKLYSILRKDYHESL